MSDRTKKRAIKPEGEPKDRSPARNKDRERETPEEADLPSGTDEMNGARAEDDTYD